MAFALTKYEARSLDIASPTYKRGIQQVVLDITGTSADVDLDLGDDSGTFWTAAQANTTYGELAKKALASLKRIVDQAQALVSVESQELLTKNQIVALDSSASVGGNVTETLTVTGLLTTDRILAATIVEDGANAAYIQEAAKTCATNGQYVVTFSADPGAGAEVRVLVQRGQAELSIQDKRPNFSMAAGSGLTSYKIILTYELNNSVYPENALYGQS